MSADVQKVEVRDQDLFEKRLTEIRNEQEHATLPNKLWLSHHWPADHDQRCITIAGQPVCRRCAALHPLSLIVATLAVFGFPLWPASLDPGIIWLLSIPATVAFVGEAIGLFAYSPKWQVATTGIAALAFGRALGYELESRWHPYFWGPIAVFGGLWFFASWYGHWRQNHAAL